MPGTCASTRRCTVHEYVNTSTLDRLLHQVREGTTYRNPRSKRRNPGPTQDRSGQSAPYSAVAARSSFVAEGCWRRHVGGRRRDAPGWSSPRPAGRQQTRHAGVGL